VRRDPPPREPRPLGALVPRVLRDLGLDETARVLRVAECWEAAVGAEVARVARPTALHGEVLEVEVPSSVWCQQLVLRRPELLAGLRRVLGDDAPRDLRLRVG